MKEDDLAMERGRRLEVLRAKVHSAWARLGVPTPEQVAFLRRVDEAAPYNDALAAIYERKAGELTAAAPTINLIKRREAVLSTLQGVQRYLKNPARAKMDGTAGSLKAAGFDLPNTEGKTTGTSKQANAYRQQLIRLKQQYAANTRDLRDTNVLIERALAGFAETFGHPFSFRGQDYQALIDEGRAQGEEEADIDLTIFMRVSE